MFSTECDLLVKNYPDLADAIQKISKQFEEIGIAESIRPDDLASFLELDPNQVRTVLTEFTRSGLLQEEEIVECIYCGTAVLKSDYEKACKNEGGYRCTICDNLLEDQSIRSVITYRSGKKWPKISSNYDLANPDETSSSRILPHLDEQTFYDPSRLAKLFNVDRDVLRKRLERYRNQHLLDDSWRENEGRRPRQDKYSYRLKNIKQILIDMSQSPQRQGKCQT